MNPLYHSLTSLHLLRYVTTNIILTFFLQPMRIHKHQISKYQILQIHPFSYSFPVDALNRSRFKKAPHKKSNRRKRSQKSVKTKLGGSTTGPMVVNIFGCPKKHPEKHQFEEVWKNPYKINKHLLRRKVLGVNQTHTFSLTGYMFGGFRSSRGVRNTKWAP